MTCPQSSLQVLAGLLSPQLASLFETLLGSKRAVSLRRPHPLTNPQGPMKAETLTQNSGHLWRVVPASEHTAGPAEDPVGTVPQPRAPLCPHCPWTGAGPQSRREKGLAAGLQGGLPLGLGTGSRCLPVAGTAWSSASACCGSPGRDSAPHCLGVRLPLLRALHGGWRA